MPVTGHHRYRYRHRYRHRCRYRDRDRYRSVTCVPFPRCGHRLHQPPVRDWISGWEFLRNRSLMNPNLSRVLNKEVFTLVTDYRHTCSSFILVVGPRHITGGNATSRRSQRVDTRMCNSRSVAATSTTQPPPDTCNSNTRQLYQKLGRSMCTRRTQSLKC